MAHATFLDSRYTVDYDRKAEGGEGDEKEVDERLRGAMPPDKFAVEMAAEADCGKQARAPPTSHQGIPCPKEGGVQAPWRRALG